MTNQDNATAPPQGHPWERAHQSASELADALRDIQEDGFWGHWRAHIEPTDGDQRPVFFMQGAREDATRPEQESELQQLLEEYQRRLAIADEAAAENDVAELAAMACDPDDRRERARRIGRTIKSEEKLVAALYRAEEIFLRIIDVRARTLADLQAKAQAWSIYERPLSSRHKDAPEQLVASIMRNLLALSA